MSQADEAVAAWARFVRWLTDDTPAHADALNPPATEEQIARAESVMGVGIPAELRQLLKLNNGSTAKHRSLTGNVFRPSRIRPCARRR